MLKKLGSNLKEQKGFTLIELLAVIVILGIIAAIAIPAIGNVIKNSDNKAKVQDALLIMDAAKLYVADNDPGTKVVKMGGSSPTNELSDYLDRVKDEDGEYTVKINRDTNGKYTYTLSGHDANGLGNIPAADASPDHLLNYDPNGTPAGTPGGTPGETQDPDGEE